MGALIQPGFLYWDGLKYVIVGNPSTQGPAGGDLAGFFPNPTVIGIRGRSLSASAPSDGQVLTWSALNSNWVPQTVSITVTGPAGGDLGGSYPDPSVVNIHGASVPVAGSLTTGNVLQVTGPNALSYAPINLGGGAAYVTGTLPVANQGSQNMGGDISGTTNSAFVAAISGNGGPNVPINVNILAFNKAQTTPSIIQSTLTTDVATNNLSIQAQNAYASAVTHLTGGNLNLAGGWATQDGYAAGLINIESGLVLQNTTITSSTYHVDTNTHFASDLIIFTDSTSNTITITLPVPIRGRKLWFKDKTGQAATHRVVIQQHAAETIDGSTSITMVHNYDAVLLVSDGTNWSIMSEYAGSGIV